MKKLVHDLKSKCKINTNESFLKVILQGARHAFNEEACISSLMSLKKGCFIAQAGYSEEKRCEIFSEVSEGAKKLSDLAVQLVYDAVNELQEEESTIREPVILVLDYEVQVGLCWFFPSLPFPYHYEIELDYLVNFSIFITVMVIGHMIVEFFVNLNASMQTGRVSFKNE